MTSPETDCASDCCQDADCPCVKVCDETYCGRHHAEEAKKWAAYFGLREGMTREERRAQIEQHRPETKRGCGVVFCPYCGQDADPDTRVCRPCGEGHGLVCGESGAGGKVLMCPECEDLVSSTTWTGLPYVPPELTKEERREINMESWDEEMGS